MNKMLGTVTVFSEDGAEDAHATIQTVVKKMLVFLEPHCPTNRISFLPRDEAEASAVRANRWKSTKGEDDADIRLLVRTIATRIAVERGFVIFHFDGDRRWVDRTNSENRQKWESIIEVKVRRMLESNESTSNRVQQCLDRLIPVVPFYSIEAWLYQNTVAADRLCRESHNGADVDQLAVWQNDRTLLDEVVKPKEACVLNSEYNLELAGAGFPASAVYEAEKSYHQTVERMKASTSLCKLLKEAIASLSAR